jgi:hypothetical protein
MKSFPTHPDHVSIQELSAWGEEHKDPWVRRLAYYAEMLVHFIPSEYRNDPDEWFDARRISCKRS